MFCTVSEEITLLWALYHPFSLKTQKRKMTQMTLWRIHLLCPPFATGHTWCQPASCTASHPTTHSRKPRRCQSQAGNAQLMLASLILAEVRNYYYASLSIVYIVWFELKIGASLEAQWPCLVSWDKHKRGVRRNERTTHTGKQMMLSDQL